VRLAKLIIGPNSAALKAASLQARIDGDTGQAVDLLAEAKLREKRYERALRILRN
jgi:hypothetical protein